MKLRTKLAVPALFLAVAPVAAQAQQVLFSDNFDAGNSATRYDLFHVDNDTDTEVLDTSANFAFDYGQFIYKRTNAIGEIDFLPIPSAPNSAGGTTTGLRFSVNDSLPGGTAIINAYPKIAEFAGAAIPGGNYTLKFDMWMNYNGFREGGAGSTQFMVAGIKQQGDGIGGPVDGPGPFPTRTGYAMAVAGERGNAAAYRLYKDNTRFTDFAAAGYIAQPETSSTGTAITPANGLNSFYQTLFPEPEYETGGAPGKNWVTVEISHIDGVLTYKMNGTTIATREDTALESGNILLGYADFATSVANPAEDNFVIFDNVVVTGFPVTRPPRWIADADGAWSNPANWEGGVPNAADAVANFLDDITAPRTITHDDRHMVGSLLFDSDHAYTIAGFSGLSLRSTTGPATITVLRGSHTISTPLNPVSDLAINIGGATAPNAKLTTGGLFQGGANITKSGGGTLVTPVIDITKLAIDAGTVALTPDRVQGSLYHHVRVNELDIAGANDAWTGTLDITKGSLVILPDAATREEVLRRTMNQVKSARNAAAGPWKGTGITSTDAANDSLRGLAVILNDRGDGTPIFAEVDQRPANANAVIVMYTYNGDADLNGRINADDYFRIDSGFLAQVQNPTYRDGDFNYDNRINADDYFLIDSAFLGQGPSIAAAPLAAVPEPGSFAALACAALAASIRRRRRR